MSSRNERIRPSAKGTDRGNSATPRIQHTSADAQMALLLDQLRNGQLSPLALPAALLDFYLLGHAQALATVLPELTRAEQERDQARADADRYYGHLYNPRTPIRFGMSYAEIEAIRRDTYYGGAQ